MIFSCHNLKELIFFDAVKLMILKNIHLLHAFFSARAYALAEGGGGKDVPHFAIFVTLSFHEKVILWL